MRRAPFDHPGQPGRVIRDCLQQHVQREHGTRTAYVLDRCRACTDANRLAAQRRRKAIAYGRWTGLERSDAARLNVQQLRCARLSLQRAATLADVGYGTVARLVYRAPSCRQPPTAQLRHDAQRRLMNLRNDVNNVPPGGRVDATGSRRRLQALVAAGLPTRVRSRRRDPEHDLATDALQAAYEGLGPVRLSLMVPSDGRAARKKKPLVPGARRVSATAERTQWLRWLTTMMRSTDESRPASRRDVNFLGHSSHMMRLDRTTPRDPGGGVSR
jgi:hypothetical protein